MTYDILELKLEKRHMINRDTVGLRPTMLCWKPGILSPFILTIVNIDLLDFKNYTKYYVETEPCHVIFVFANRYNCNNLHFSHLVLNNLQNVSHCLFIDHTHTKTTSLKQMQNSSFRDKCTAQIIRAAISATEN